MNSLKNDIFIKNISQISTISIETIEKMEREIALLDIPWSEAYTDYQSSGWKTISLMNQSGQSEDVVIGDGSAIETDIMSFLPTLKSYINFLPLHYMWVRLAKLEPNSFLWEHKDYTDLSDRKRLRFHLPISTNKSSLLILLGHQVHLGKGYLWKLDPQVAHGACNMGPSARIHLIIDCYVDDILENLLNEEWLDPAFLKPLLKGDINDAVVAAKKIAKLDFYQTAERMILKTYHNQVQPEGECYDKIIEMYDELGVEELSRKWTSKKNKFLSSGIVG